MPLLSRETEDNEEEEIEMIEKLANFGINAGAQEITGLVYSRGGASHGRDGLTFSFSVYFDKATSRRPKRQGSTLSSL